MNDPAEDSWAFARDFVARGRWTFAVTYAAWAPHEYVVRGRTAAAADFDRFAALIAEKGTEASFGGFRTPYLKLGEYKYWHIDPVINRCHESDQFGAIRDISGAEIGRRRRAAGVE